MQGRMKQHQLTDKQIITLLNTTEVGRIATQNPDGYPYVVPVHYTVINDKIYIHGLIKGQKISNIALNNKVCFEIDSMGAILPDDTNPCDTNTEFDSVVILGTAVMIENTGLKLEVLKSIVKKYTPQLSHLEFPEKMMRATGIIEITPEHTTGKYYR